MSEFTEKSLIKYNLLHNGDVAQLGECRVRNAKVGSSILLVSTTISRPDVLWPAADYFHAVRANPSYRPETDRRATRSGRHAVHTAPAD